MHRDRKVYKENPEMKENINLANLKHIQMKVPSKDKPTITIKDKPKQSNNYNVEQKMTISSATVTRDKNKIKQEPSYLERENSVLIHEYGNATYLYMKMLESESIPHNFISRTRLSGVRTKMVDWMVEVLTVFNCEDNIFFLAVHIMDLCIVRSLYTLRPEDIHLLGITSMFLASKFEESNPLTMETVVDKVSHSEFTA
jgi:hypothetical protein